MGTPFYGIWNRAKGDIVPEILQDICGDRLLGQVPIDNEIESFDYQKLNPETKIQVAMIWEMLLKKVGMQIDRTLTLKLATAGQYI